MFTQQQLKWLSRIAVQASSLAEDDTDTTDPWRPEPLFRPLPLAQFCAEHMGIPLFPMQQYDLERFLGTNPKELFEVERSIPYTEAFLLWGKGSGKDTVCSLVQCWIAHLLLCLKSPQQYLGLAVGEPIDVVNVAYNQIQARTVFFYKFKQRLKRWQWLRQVIDYLHPEIGGDRWMKESGGWIGADAVILPNGIRCWSVPSTPDSFEGKNILFWIADEMSAFCSPAKLPNAAKIHQTLVSSARTRFNNRWRGFAISFPRHKGDYMVEIVDRAQRGELPETYAVVRASWEVNPNITRESLQPDYDRDPEGSACRYECRPPSAIDAYFRSPDLLVRHATGVPLELAQQVIADPALAQFVAMRGRNPILEQTPAGDPILDAYGFPKLATWFRGEVDPRGVPYDYYIHLDPGLSGDAFGFALGHLHQYPRGLRPVIDLAFRWTGSQFREFGTIQRRNGAAEEVTAAEVDFRTVREFIYYLADDRDFNIYQISADTWNSADSLQELRKRGYQIVNHVVRKADYDEFKALVYNRQLEYYGWPILIAEAQKLQLINGTKIEAPRTAEGGEGVLDSHKDVTDAVAALCWYFARVVGEGIEFLQIEMPEQPPPFVGKDLALTGDRLAAMQQRLLADFFAGD